MYGKCQAVTEFLMVAFSAKTGDRKFQGSTYSRVCEPTVLHATAAYWAPNL